MDFVRNKRSNVQRRKRRKGKKPYIPLLLSIRSRYQSYISCKTYAIVTRVNRSMEEKPNKTKNHIKLVNKIYFIFRVIVVNGETNNSTKKTKRILIWPIWRNQMNENEQKKNILRKRWRSKKKITNNEITNWIIDEYNGQNIIKYSRRFYTKLKTNHKQIHIHTAHGVLQTHKHTINNFNFIWIDLIVKMPVVRCSIRTNNETIWSQIDEIISIATAQSCAHKTETASVWITNKMHDWKSNWL